MLHHCNFNKEINEISKPITIDLLFPFKLRKIDQQREHSSSHMAFHLLFLISFLSSAILSFSYVPRNHEVDALISIRRALNDTHGVLNNWDANSVDPCTWVMITCSSENLVIELGAPSQNLSGTLSGRIGNLTNLRRVSLKNNNISGGIPPELGELPNLQILDLSNNLFSSSVPQTLGQLHTLHYLRLNNNTLSGAFPVSLVKIPQLIFMDLSSNNLSGPVPKFPAARTFNIAENPLICGSRPSTDGCSGTATTVPPPLSFSPARKSSKNQKLAVAIGVSFGFLLLLAALGLLFWWRRRALRNQKVSNMNDKQEQGLIGNLRQFTLRELQSATKNFSSKNILGRGGFGNVYRGRLGDGSMVAVKRLKDVNGSTGQVQFKTEVELIGLAVHRNLLRLVGFCSTSKERLLVYPYMSNGSVASRIRGKPTLDWNTRKRIALGAARGLLYLHEQCHPKIIHRDVKAANVLLDDDCEAVVGDFGLAKLLDHEDTHVSTAVRGTRGYIAPEYFRTGRSSEKTDVFGFGMLLLELITGTRALDFGESFNHQKGAIIEWVKKTQQDLGMNHDCIEVEEMVQVALLCTEHLPAHRPKMSEVVRMLELEGGDDAGNMTPILVNDDDDHSIDAQDMELSGPR